MSTFIKHIMISLACASPLITLSAQANDSYSAAVAKFRSTMQTQSFFESAYAYALFPTIAKGGFGIGAAYGKGRVYQGKQSIGITHMTQVSIGLQLGAQAYSEIIFFRNKQALKYFISGTFEFGAQASAVALTIGAAAQAGSTGNSASAGNHIDINSNHATGAYINDMAVFTLAKGGLMYEAALAGQSFTFSPQ